LSSNIYVWRWFLIVSFLFFELPFLIIWSKGAPSYSEMMNAFQYFLVQVSWILCMVDLWTLYLILDSEFVFIILSKLHRELFWTHEFCNLWFLLKCEISCVSFTSLWYEWYKII
jgi:hypothetical protein